MSKKVQYLQITTLVLLILLLFGYQDLYLIYASQVIPAREGESVVLYPLYYDYIISGFLLILIILNVFVIFKTSKRLESSKSS